MHYVVFDQTANDAWVCTEFDGIKLVEEWSDTDPALNCYAQTIDVYKDDAKTVHIIPKFDGGVGPFKYQWTVVHPFGTIDNYVDSGREGSSNDYNLQPGDKKVVCTCFIKDSSVIQKSGYCHTTINYIDEMRPIPEPVEPVNPVEPEPIPEPVNPTPVVEEKSNVTTYVMIAAAVVAIGCVLKFGLGLF